jgi:hypothetical protein
LRVRQIDRNVPADFPSTRFAHASRRRSRSITASASRLRLRHRDAAVPVTAPAVDFLSAVSFGGELRVYLRTSPTPAAHRPFDASVDQTEAGWWNSDTRETFKINARLGGLTTWWEPFIWMTLLSGREDAGQMHCRGSQEI